MRQNMSRMSVTWVAALLIAVFSLCAPIAALGEGALDEAFPGVTARVPVRQEFVTNVPDVSGSFSYVLEARTEGAPLPAGGRDGIYSFTMDGNTQRELKIEARGIGQYAYKLYQHVAGEQDGYKYDRKVYDVTLYVYIDTANRPAVSVVINGEGEPKTATAVFKNSYSGAKPTPPPEDGGSVQTGDDNNLTVYLTLMIACIVGLTLLGVWVMRMRSKQKGDTTYEK